MNELIRLQSIFCIVLCLLSIDMAAAFDRPEIVLWPEGMPEPAVPSDPAEKSETGADGISRRYNVSRPRLIVYQPTAESVRARSNAGVVVIPGGGFGKLADGHEGAEACEWLAKHGVTAFQLVHRTPTSQHIPPNAGPVQDAQKSMLEVRRRAAEFGLAADRLGVLGFSAGGQVALIASTNSLRFESKGSDVSHRPDFLLAIYPYQIFDAQKKQLREDIRLDSMLPPTFIAQMGDDKASLAQGSALLYLGLIERGVPAELHIYERGGHGFGMRHRDGASGPTDWPHRALDWLTQHGIVSVH